MRNISDTVDCRRIMLRVIVVISLSSFFLLYRFLATKPGPVCINDAWHNFSSGLNEGLDNGGKDNVVIGIGQVLMDAWIVTAVVVWFIFIKNTRFGLAAGFFFGARTFMLFTVTFPFPEHVVWHSPGFPSLTVPYDPTTDFYFSGHTGTLTVIMLEFIQLRCKWIALLCLVSLIYMMNMLTITRVHYTIDIVGGLIFSFFMHRNVAPLVYCADWIISQPYSLSVKAIAAFKKYRSKKISTSLLVEEVV